MSWHQPVKTNPGDCQDDSLQVPLNGRTTTLSGEESALLDALPTAAVFFDPEFRIVECNRMAAKLLGHDPRALRGRELHDLLVESGRGSILDDLSRPLDHFEVWWQPREGPPLMAEVARRTVTDSLGQALGYLLVITDPVRQRSDLLESNQQLLESREAERMSLARELHDGAVQELIAIGFSLAELLRRLKVELPELDETPIRQLQGSVLAVIRRLRALVTDLRPAGLEEFGLSASVEGLAAKLLRDYPAGETEIHFELQELPELTHPEQLCLFRATQEGLSNCLKHARASNIWITLRQDAEGPVQLTIQDDGVGFEVPADLSEFIRSEHFGLAGMAERVRLIRSPGRAAASRLRYAAEKRGARRSLVAGLPGETSSYPYSAPGRGALIVSARPDCRRPHPSSIRSAGQRGRSLRRCPSGTRCFPG